MYKSLRHSVQEGRYGKVKAISSRGGSFLGRSGLEDHQSSQIYSCLSGKCPQSVLNDILLLEHPLEQSVIRLHPYQNGIYDAAQLAETLLNGLRGALVDRLLCILLKPGMNLPLQGRIQTGHISVDFLKERPVDVAILEQWHEHRLVNLGRDQREELVEPELRVLILIHRAIPHQVCGAVEQRQLWEDSLNREILPCKLYAS